MEVIHIYSRVFFYRIEYLNYGWAKARAEADFIWAG